MIKGSLFRGKCDVCHRNGVVLVRVVTGRRISYQCLIRRDCTEAVLRRVAA